MANLENLCGRKLGEFVLHDRIDEGGFGDLYLCEQPLLHRMAVIKVLHPQLRHDDVTLQRFVREAKLASLLDHPYAAHVYAFGIESDDGLFWIAMERVQGFTLTRWLQERGPLALDQFIPFFERVTEVVHTAHEHGIVHRDLKPSNVMVIECAGRLLPKLLDFGIAKLLDDAAVPAPAPPPTPASPADVEPSARPRAVDRDTKPLEHTQHATTGPMKPLTGGHAIGSPPYMSPEQWTDPTTVGPASDIYALGIIAYETLTGRNPFNAHVTAEYKVLHLSAAVPPLGGAFSPALDRVIQRAMAKRPEDRWSSALEFSAALRGASDLGTGSADLLRLDERVSEAWLGDAPQPLAELVAALDAARNAHQARDAAQELVRYLVRYLLVLALVTRAQVRDERDDPALLELMRAMRRRDLTDAERVQLVRFLVRPMLGRRSAHPIPELVDLVAPRGEPATDDLDAILALCATSDHAGTEDMVRARLARLVPELGRKLNKLTFVLDYALVIPRNNEVEYWTGVRRKDRAFATVKSGGLVKHHPMLLANYSRVCVDLWPLMQAVAPTEGAEPELFLFDGRGRNGARMIAANGFEHHDPTVWEWLSTRVIAQLESKPEVDSDDRPPYLGLTPFAASDAARFVGRESEVQALLGNLRERPLQLVVGPSGAGKSSFVHAGVIPALPASWRTITLRPGATPLATLAARLVAANLTTTDLRPVLEGSPSAAAAIVAHAASRGTILIVIDQLEELFTQCQSPDERKQFAAVIAQLAASADAPIRVICTLRDDFLMQLDALAPLHGKLSPAVMLLGNPSRDELMRIVVEPARRAGYTLSDPELAFDMASVVADRPGALALLSFTMFQLWGLRDRRFHHLTRNAYDAMGGVAGALGRHAEATLTGLSADDQRLARELFRHLVTADGARTRLTYPELRQRLAAPHANALIDALATARLLSVSECDGEAQVEVIHEALITAWPRLQGWIHEDVEGARTREQVRFSARQWQDRARPQGLLWRGDALADLERWMRRTAAVAFSDLETAFVEASRRQEAAALEASRRLARRTTWIWRGLAAAAAVTAFAGFEYRAKLQTRMAEEIATQVAVQADVEQGRQALLHGESADALLHLSQAFQHGDRSPGVSFMYARALQPRLAERARFESTSGRMWSATFSPDGKRIVTTDDKAARVWDAQTYRLLFALPHGDIVYQAVYSTDGTWLATACADGAVRIWDAASGKQVHELRQTGKLRRYYTLAISPDNTTIAAIDFVGEVAHVWNTTTGAAVAELRNDANGVPSLAFSADGRWLATSGGDDVRVFDAATWKQVLVLRGPRVLALAFDPTGPRLATGTFKGDASIWAIPTGARLQHLREVGAPVDRVAFSPSGALVMTAARDGAEQVWQAQSGELQSEFNQHHGKITSVDFDRTSKLVLAAGPGGVVAISDAIQGMPVAVLEGTGSVVWDAHFDPTSHRVLGASFDGSARLWDAAPSYLGWRSPPVADLCNTDDSLEPDQRTIAIRCSGHATRIWDTAHDQLVAELPSVTTVDGDFESAFPVVSATGDRAAIARGNTVEIYALPGGTLLRTITQSAAVNAVAFGTAGHDLVSGGVDGSLLVTRDGSDPMRLPEAAGGIDAVGILSDGRVVGTDTHRRLRVIDSERNIVLAALELPGRVRLLRPAPDGVHLLTLPIESQQTPPVLWDLERYRPVGQLEGHVGRVWSARFVRDGREILTAGADGTARLWDAATGHLLQTYRGGSRFLADAALAPDSSVVVAGGGDGLLRFWDEASARQIWTLQAHKSHVLGIHFEGENLVTRGFTGDVARWRLSTVAQVIKACSGTIACDKIRK